MGNYTHCQQPPSPLIIKIQPKEKPITNFNTIINTTPTTYSSLTTFINTINNYINTSILTKEETNTLITLRETTSYNFYNS